MYLKPLKVTVTEKNFSRDSLMIENALVISCVYMFYIKKPAGPFGVFGTHTYWTSL